jgi:hypothetical protein
MLRFVTSHLKKRLHFASSPWTSYVGWPVAGGGGPGIAAMIWSATSTPCLTPTSCSTCLQKCAESEMLFRSFPRASSGGS